MASSVDENNKCTSSTYHELNMTKVIKYLNRIWYTVSAQYIAALYYNTGELRQAAGFTLSFSLDLRDFKGADVKRDMAQLVLGKSIMKITFLTRFSRSHRNNCPKVWTKAKDWILVLPVLQIGRLSLLHSIQRCPCMQTHSDTLTSELPLLARAASWMASL